MFGLDVGLETSFTKQIRLDQIKFFDTHPDIRKRKLEAISNLYKLMFAQYRDELVANISVEGGQLDQRTPETPH